MGSARVNNWGRWGASDELGALNFITPDKLVAAGRLVRRGKVYSLALPIQAQDAPVLPRRSPPLHFMTMDGGDYAAGLKRKSGFQASDDYLALFTHGTTHIDALAHVWYDDALYNGFAGNTVRSSGAQKCSIDRVKGLVGRGVMVDLCRHRGVERLAAGEVITSADILDAAKAQGTAIGEGDILLVRCGWLSMFREQGAGPFFAEEPGIGMDAARWIAETGIAAIGLDNYGVEVVPTEDRSTAPVHRILIRDFGVYLLELLDLDSLAADSVHEFLFAVAPLRITGGVGSPINPLAIA